LVINIVTIISIITANIQTMKRNGSGTNRETNHKKVVQEKPMPYLLVSGRASVIFFPVLIYSSIRKDRIAT
jgi:hypothetical protein